jgi:hypothetical protein
MSELGRPARNDGPAPRMSLFVAIWLAMVVGSLLSFLGFAYELTFAPLRAGLLPYAGGTAIAVVLLTVFGFLAPENR